MEDLQCLIIEDDPLAGIILEQLILTRTNLKISGVFEDANLAYEFLSKSDFKGLLFLDIELKNGSGIEMVQKLKSIPDIIFTTSHENFAFTAYELGAIDYLRKPISPVRFDMAVERYKLNHALKKSEQTTATVPEEYLFFKTGKDLFKLKMNAIFYFEASKDYVKIHTETGSYLILSTMKELEARLSASKFIRIGKSYIVNAVLIDRISGSQVYIRKNSLKISRSYLQEVKEKLDQLQQAK